MIIRCLTCALTFLFVSVIHISAASAQMTQAHWDALKSGQAVALMRHALAPGMGDPDHFDLKDCSTQRNLSLAGRMQSKRIGQMFTSNGIENVDVYSSQWCRCMETAQYLGLGEVKALPALNSFFREFSRKEKQTKALGTWLQNRKSPTPTILVTHQVNITAYTGVFPASGEILIVETAQTGTPKVLARIETLE